jgi:hypothetical protein
MQAVQPGLAFGIMTHVEVTDRIDLPGTVRHGLAYRPGDTAIVPHRVLTAATRGMGRWWSQALSFGISQWGMPETAGRNVSHPATGVRGGTHMEGLVRFAEAAP